MKRFFNTSVALVLLSAYLHLGVVGHFIQWTANGGWGQNGQQVTKSKPPQPTRVLWTQDNHIVTVVKTTVPAPAILPSVVPTSSTFEVYGLVCDIDQESHSASKVSSSDRAPPSFNVYL